MRFIDMQGFCIRPDKQVAMQQWLTANEDRIRRSYPEGCEYGGIYVAPYTSEKHAGECFWLDILDSYAGLDRAAALANEPDSEYAKIGREFMEFIDFSRTDSWSHVLLKSVVDATMWDAPAG